MFLSAQFLSMDVILSQLQGKVDWFVTFLSIMSIMATILILAKMIVWKKEKTAERSQFLLVLLSQLFINITFLFWNMVNESESVDYSTALIGIHSNKIYISTFLFSLVLSGA